MARTVNNVHIHAASAARYDGASHASECLCCMTEILTNLAMCAFAATSTPPVAPQVHVHHHTRTERYVIDASQPSLRYPNRQVLIVHHQEESICCPLLILLFGFSMPVVWLLGCWYTESPSRTVRLLGQMSVVMLLITVGSFIIVSFSIWDRTGRFPWEHH